MAGNHGNKSKLSLSEYKQRRIAQGKELRPELIPNNYDNVLALGNQDNVKESDNHGNNLVKEPLHVDTDLDSDCQDEYSPEVPMYTSSSPAWPGVPLAITGEPAPRTAYYTAAPSPVEPDVSLDDSTCSSPGRLTVDLSFQRPSSRLEGETPDGIMDETSEGRSRDVSGSSSEQEKSDIFPEVTSTINKTGSMFDNLDKIMEDITNAPHSPGVAIESGSGQGHEEYHHSPRSEAMSISEDEDSDPDIGSDDDIADSPLPNHTDAKSHQDDARVCDDTTGAVSETSTDYRPGGEDDDDVLAMFVESTQSVRTGTGSNNASQTVISRDRHNSRIIETRSDGSVCDVTGNRGEVGSYSTRIVDKDSEKEAIVQEMLRVANKEGVDHMHQTPVHRKQNVTVSQLERNEQQPVVQPEMSPTEQVVPPVLRSPEQDSVYLLKERLLSLAAKSPSLSASGRFSASPPGKVVPTSGRFPASPPGKVVPTSGRFPASSPGKVVPTSGSLRYSGPLSRDQAPDQVACPIDGGPSPAKRAKHETSLPDLSQNTITSETICGIRVEYKAYTAAPDCGIASLRKNNSPLDNTTPQDSEDHRNNTIYLHYFLRNRIKFVSVSDLYNNAFGGQSSGRFCYNNKQTLFKKHNVVPISLSEEERQRKFLGDKRRRLGVKLSEAVEMYSAFLVHQEKQKVLQEVRDAYTANNAAAVTKGLQDKGLSKRITVSIPDPMEGITIPDHSKAVTAASLSKLPKRVKATCPTDSRPVRDSPATSLPVSISSNIVASSSPSHSTPAPWVAASDPPAADAPTQSTWQSLPVDVPTKLRLAREPCVTTPGTDSSVERPPVCKSKTPPPPLIPLGQVVPLRPVNIYPRGEISWGPGGSDAQEQQVYEEEIITISNSPLALTTVSDSPLPCGSYSPSGSVIDLPSSSRSDSPVETMVDDDGAPDKENVDTPGTNEGRRWPVTVKSAMKTNKKNSDSNNNENSPLTLENSEGLAISKFTQAHEKVLQAITMTANQSQDVQDDQKKLKEEFRAEKEANCKLAERVRALEQALQQKDVFPGFVGSHKPSLPPDARAALLAASSIGSAMSSNRMPLQISPTRLVNPNISTTEDRHHVGTFVYHNVFTGGTHGDRSKAREDVRLAEGDRWHTQSHPLIPPVVSNTSHMGAPQSNTTIGSHLMAPPQVSRYVPPGVRGQAETLNCDVPFGSYVTTGHGLRPVRNPGMSPTPSRPYSSIYAQDNRDRVQGVSGGTPSRDREKGVSDPSKYSCFTYVTSPSGVSNAHPQEATVQGVLSNYPAPDTVHITPVQGVSPGQRTSHQPGTYMQTSPSNIRISPRGLHTSPYGGSYGPGMGDFRPTAGVSSNSNTAGIPADRASYFSGTPSNTMLNPYGVHSDVTSHQPGKASRVTSYGGGGVSCSSITSPASSGPVSDPVDLTSSQPRYETITPPEIIPLADIPVNLMTSRNDVITKTTSRPVTAQQPAGSLIQPDRPGSCLPQQSRPGSCLPQPARPGSCVPPPSMDLSGWAAMPPLYPTGSSPNSGGR